MKIAHFECLGGVAGDMTLAALLDAGCPADALRELPARLKLDGVQVEIERVKRQGIAATFVRVRVDPSAQKKHRHLHHIRAIIEAADLPPAAAARALRVFERLADAEAAVHGTTAQKVHFHEVGANDAIVDIVGVSLALSLLGVDRVTCSPIPTGHGTVVCEHGVMPIPAPATARLLIGVPLEPVDQAGEMTTPTGAALMTGLADAFGPAPAMAIAALGYGAGAAEWQARPNLLRVLIGNATATQTAAATGDLDHDTVTVLETQVDDMTGQAVAAALEHVLALGALDAYTMPIGMKKGRPGHLLTVLADEARAAAIVDALLEHTSTLGVRMRREQRCKLARESQTIETRYGHIAVKVARRGRRVLHVWPEYDDAARAAHAHNVPVAEVQQAALQQWRNQNTHADTPDAVGHHPR